MNLSTYYLGLKLKNPLMPGASPLTASFDTARRLEDAGASALVLPSLFEEQILLKQNGTFPSTRTEFVEAFDEAMDYMPKPGDFPMDADDYLGHIARLKKSVSVPVIGSLNGVTQGKWLDRVRGIEQAGADALELNFYEISADSTDTSVDVEIRAIEMLRAVKENTRIPVAVKLSPFFSSLPNFASELTASGAAGLVFFNHFYQADIDIEAMEMLPALHLSESSELLLRLRWLAIVSACVNTTFAVSGGVHDATGVLKSVMTGANAVQLVSVLLKRGPAYLKTLLNEIENWIERHGHASLMSLRGIMALNGTLHPKAFERASYIRVLHEWQA